MNDRSKTTVGGGGLWLGVAKLWFLVASYGVSVSLTHLLSPEAYGRYYVVARIIAVPNMVIIYTLLFSVSRPLAAQFDQGFASYRSLRSRGLRLAAGLGGVTAVVIFVAAPQLSRWQQGDDALTWPIRAVAPISLAYALYAVNLGTLNATRRFRRQASLDITMATTKASLMIGAAALGLGLTSTLAGFTTASVFVLVLSVFAVMGLAPKSGGNAPTPPSMARFAGVLIVFTAIVNLLQSTDLLIVNSLVAKDRASDVGFYSSAEQVALIPYSLMNAVALVVFPLVASLDPQREPGKVRSYLGATLKISVVLLALMSSVGAAAAESIQSLLFPKAYGAAASELQLLVWGFSGYSITVTSAWIFNSVKRSRVAVALVAVPLVLVIGFCFGLVPGLATRGAAVAVAVAGAGGAFVSMVTLWRLFGARLTFAQLVKIGAAVGAVAVVSYLWPEFSTSGLVGKFAIVLQLSVLTVTFVGVVALTRLVSLPELKELRRVR